MLTADLSEYSVITTEQLLDNLGDVSTIITNFVEKPEETASLDSDLAAVGRYVLSADIWGKLERTELSAWVVFS